MEEELEELKKMIEGEEERSYARQRSESDKKEYDYRRGLRYALRKIEEMKNENKKEVKKSK